MASGAEVLRKIKEQIREVDPKEVHDRDSNGNGTRPPVIVDVREQHEFEESHLPGAIHVPRGHLESRIEGAVSDRSQPVVLYCASGNRSAFAAQTMTDLLGYEDVASMRGGITLWKDRGYEVEVPRALTGEQRERYSRHLLIPEIGLEGQLKLLDAKVLLLGAGGLGDIGEHFPDTDEAWRDADSMELLRTVVARVGEAGYGIEHVDATVMLERPKLAPHREAMRTAVAGALGVEPARVTVRATTTDGLGFTGRREGAACHAVALLRRPG